MAIHTIIIGPCGCPLCEERRELEKKLAQKTKELENKINNPAPHISVKVDPRDVTIAQLRQNVERKDEALAQYEKELANRAAQIEWSKRAISNHVAKSNGDREKIQKLKKKIKKLKKEDKNRPTCSGKGKYRKPYTRDEITCECCKGTGLK